MPPWRVGEQSMEQSWSCEEKYLHINILELKAAKIAILTFCKEKTIKWFIFRSTMGGHGEMENDGENENDENGGKKNWSWFKRPRYRNFVSTYHAYCRIPFRDQKHESESDTNYFF